MGVADLFETLVLTHYSTLHNIVPIIYDSLGKKMSTRVCMALREIQMRYCLVAQCRKSRLLCDHCCSPEQGWSHNVYNNILQTLPTDIPRVY